MLETGDIASTLTSSLTTSDDSIVKNSEDYQSFPVALLNLLNTLIGAEILSVGNSMIFCGFTISVGLMVFTALLSYIGTILIIRLQQQVAAESINDMANKIVGSWMGKCFSGITLFFTYSNLMSYLFIGGDTVCDWMAHAIGDDWKKGVKRALIVFVYALVLPIALSIPKQMEFIDTASGFAIVAQMLFIACAITEGVHKFPTEGINPTAETAMMNINFFNAFAIYSTLYALPAVVLPQLEPFTPDLKKRYLLLGAGFCLCFVIDIVPSAIGYLIYGKDTQQLLYNSFDNNAFTEVVKVGFFFIVNASYPIVSLQVMTDVCAMIFKEHNPRNIAWKKRIIGLLIANVPPVLIAMVMPNVRPIFEVGGAFGGCLSNFFFPPLLYFLQSGKRWFNWQSILLLLFAFFGIVSCVIGTYEAIEETIHDFKGE